FGVVQGGPGNDTLTSLGELTILRGGPGDDTLIGSNSSDELRGGGGSDVLMGNGGGDTLIGDGANDRPAPDLIDGGPGHDVVSYANRRRGVTVNLERVSGNGG